MGRGHLPILVADPQDFLKTALAEKPDLVIMDIQMPAGGGPMVDRMIRGHDELADLPVVYCSGMGEAEMKRWFPEDPRRRYHGKPVRFDLLARQIDELLAAG